MTEITLFQPLKSTTAKPSVFYHTLGPALQRQVCESCEDDLKKKGRTLQRFPSAAKNSAEDSAVSETIHEVLNTSGQPLDASTRKLMEPRFGHDFSRVRVHTDSRAAGSAKAVNALAYTVGNEMVFGAGHYAPHTRQGQILLAHELTHVLQQQSGRTNLRNYQIDGQPGDSAEREANQVAQAVVDGLPAPAIQSTGFGAAVQAAEDPNLGTPSPVTGAPVAPGPVCGPDVTAQVSAAITKTKSRFGGWNQAKKEAQCDALDSISTGALAWDIEELHANAWILNFRPACATQGATPPCGSTVKVGTDCYYSGSPNYVIYGVMCKLCSDHFTSVGNQSGIDRFTQAKMLYWINAYKGTGLTGLGTPSGNFGPSQDWAIAGYNGWPGGSTPTGDRNNCTPTCPITYAGRAFRVYWLPQGFI
jgi:hypothetical protein